MTNIFKKAGVLFAYRFGSTVQGNETRESDIDIAVFLPHKLTPQERFDIRLDLISKLTAVLDKEVDLVVLNDIKSIFFKYVIIKEGKRIYSSPEEDYLDFECRVMGEYFDFQPFLNEYNKNYVKNCLK